MSFIVEYISSSARTPRMKENRMVNYPALPYSRQKRVQSTSIGWSLHLISCSFLLKHLPFITVSFFLNFATIIISHNLVEFHYFLCQLYNHLFYFLYFFFVSFPIVFSSSSTPSLFLFYLSTALSSALDTQSTSFHPIHDHLLQSAIEFWHPIRNIFPVWI